MKTRYLTRFDPLWNFASWGEDWDRLLNFGARPQGTVEAATFAPRCDIEETQTHYLLNFDLPGVVKDDIDIEVQDNGLVVSGSRREERESGDAKRHVTERHYGAFRRSFELPTGIDASKIEADYRDGVLRLSVPKAETAVARKIRIKDASANGAQNNPDKNAA